MLDADFPHVADLMSSRTALHELLLDIIDPNLCRVIELKKAARNSPSKVLFHVLDPALCDMVRHKWDQLLSLHQMIEDLDVDFRMNQGLWIPALADEERGDYQVNVMISQNWATKSVTTRDILDYAKEGESGVVAQNLSIHNKYDGFRLCRECGMVYRFSVRDASVTPKRYGVNEFCIVLGTQIVVNESDPRSRTQRKDAWRGVLAPLFMFSGKRGQLWWVYPPKIINISTLNNDKF